MKKRTTVRKSPELEGRVLARVLAEDLAKVGGGATKSVSCGRGCDEIVNDCWKLADDSF